MNSYDVVIIDSGFNLEPDSNAAGVCIVKNQGELAIGSDWSDTIGHGTIISTIVRKQLDDKKIFCIKMPEDETDVSSLIFALQYVRDYVKCKFINMSLGVKTSDDLQKLYDVCLELSDMGVVLISAFDNEGCMSYPAAFDCVIGVDSKENFKKASDWDYVEDSYINVFAKGSIQRLKTENGQILLVGGASIACAYITGILAEHEEECIGVENSISFLKRNARFLYQKEKKRNRSANKYFKINKAVVFPFSKESHAFLRFSDRLDFQIKDFYDIRQSGKVGRKLSHFYEKSRSDETIKDINQIDFNDVDTIILGHLDELSGISGLNYRKKLIDIVIENNVNIFSFDPLLEYEEILQQSGINYYYPYINRTSIEKCSFGKLFKISKPVVGIFGTSSQQGKFSLQNALISSMEKLGYNVGSIGTEPHSLLFGHDVVFPIGYNSTVQLDNNEIVAYLNEKINNLCFQGKEIIIAASQAQTIPYYYNNLLEFPPMQCQFACGIHPDAIVLCINYHDEIEYIRNTMFTLMGLTDAKVVALVMYPVTRAREWNGVYGISKYVISDEEFTKKVNELNSIFHLPIYLLGENEDLEKLCNTIIDFF